MRVVRYHAFGEPDVMGIEEDEPLEPQKDEVRIEVRAAGVNPCDALRRKGLWEDDLPLIPGSDVAGIVEAVGSEESSLEVGDRVVGTVPMLNRSGAKVDRQGVYAERAVVRTSRLASLPESVPFDQAAALGIVGGTAWRALVEFGDVEPGDICLIHAGSGGVGHVAVQLAKTMDATVLSTTNAERIGIVEAFGADEVFDYACKDFKAAVEAATPDGIDLVLDHRFEEYVQFDIDITGKDSDVLVIGNNYDQPTITDLTEAIGKDVTIQPFDSFNLSDWTTVLECLVGLMADGDLTVEVARTYDLEEAPEAHRAVMEDSFVGKLVIRP
jgi:NADPH2:quinone reductase